MGLGEIQLLTWKSKATQQKEAEEYEKWAFPYGQAQRDALQKLLFAVYPKASLPETLIPFLTCKELYEDFLNKHGSSDAAVDVMINKQKKYKSVIKKKDMTTYIALVLADASIDEQCEYPAAEDIFAKKGVLEKLRRE